MKTANVITSILAGLGILLLLASAFDMIPGMDNALVFFGLACFIIVGVIKKIKA